jgi:hypothetical protein
MLHLLNTLLTPTGPASSAEQQLQQEGLVYLVMHLLSCTMALATLLEWSTT